MSKNEKTKSELEKELKELDELETKVKSKRDTLKFQKMEVPFKVGDSYFIRTVTYFATGRVKAIIGNFLVLEEAAWIADTGRFRDAIVKGILSEVEPVDVNMYVNLNSITDAFDWKHKLPDTQK
jgi:agmatine/peptidylarginine deiminase